MINKEYIKSHFKDIDENTPLYNSNMDNSVIIKYLDGLYEFNPLDPIIAIYEDDGECESGAIDFILTLKDLHEISENFEGEIALNRDVEDRFVYSNYKHWLYYKNKLIFY